MLVPIEPGQYTSFDFAVAAGNANVRLSFCSVGDAYDNAAIESFWAQLKVEIAWIRGGSIWFPTRAAVPVAPWRCATQGRRSRKPRRQRTPYQWMRAWRA